MVEYREALDQWSKGLCVNPIFGSALKDEPTPVVKDKVRVFQAAPVILQMGIRKFFLPIARFLSVNPLISECAVGINAHGSEWNALAEHMKKFGDDRIVAGDYSKYDLRMPAQLTQAAFCVMIRIAKWSGNYSEVDVRTMESIAYEVTCPLVAFNGDLMRFLGTNPSGQNMTVYINSIVNSLLNRLGFFSVYDQSTLEEDAPEFCASLGRPVRFRDCNAIAIYGDDLKGSARAGLDRHNHVSFANFLSANDMKFTMPDKESAPVPFMNDTDADFLKRKNRFDSDLGQIVGMLDENSIFKSLHASLASKECTPEEVSAQNIDGALREWFFHGREVFDQRQADMRRVVELTDVKPVDVNKSFDDRVDEWKSKYTPQSGVAFSVAPVPGDVVGAHASGNVMYQRRRYELIYAGKGIFFGGFNVMRADHLWYDGHKYSFVEYRPVDDCMFGLMHIYFVADLKQVLSPVPLLPKAFVGKAIVEICKEEFVVNPLTASGGDRFAASREECKRATVALGLSKFRVPKLRSFNCETYWNEIITIVQDGREYPAWLCYHKSQDLTRSPYIGSIRAPSLVSLGGSWVRV